MEEVQSLVRLVIWSGFGLGILFGAVASKTNFCTMGAISDVINMGHWGRMRAWLLAIAVAMLGTALLAYSGVMDMTQTIYTAPRLPWMAHLVGGLTFGIGMTLASGCGNKTLLRAGGGNLKALIVFFLMAYGALLTIRGVLAPLRTFLAQGDVFVLTLSTHQTVPHLMSSAGLGLPMAQLLCGALLAVGIFLFVFGSKDFLEEKDNVMAGIVLGLVVVAGWYVTGHLAVAENPDTLETLIFGTNSKQAESMSFVGPIAFIFDLLQRWTDSSVVMTWGIATALGVFCGALLYALSTRTFRWEGFGTPVDLVRHILGALLMGFGGITAIGCTIGQGLTGVSTLALGSFITLFAIVAGCALTMKYEYWRMMQEA